MTITMYDSVDLSQIPPDAPAVAGYVNGHWPTYSQVVQRWPNAKHLSIAVTSSADAETLDVEAGDATNADAAAWVKRQAARGLSLPVVYTSISNVAALLQALASAGITRGAVRLWTAHYGAGEHLCGPSCGFGMPTIADGTQWTDQALGRNLDQSIMSDAFFGLGGHMYSPALPPVCASLKDSVSGGVWLLNASGAVYAIEGAPYLGGANGQSYFVGRAAASLKPYGRGYTIVATSGETYNYPAP